MPGCPPLPPSRESILRPNQPIDRTRDDYAEIIEKISVANSPVGIDAQYTHAIIIAYLQQISERLQAIESRLDSM